MDIQAYWAEFRANGYEEFTIREGHKQWTAKSVEDILSGSLDDQKHFVTTVVAQRQK